MAILERRSITKRSRPRMVIVPVDLNRNESPDNFPTIRAYLKATGKITMLTHAAQLKARSMFIAGKSIPEIVTATELEPHMIDRLSMLNGWEDARDRKLLASFQSTNKLAQRVLPDIDDRHDRIAGTIETVTERLLHKHQDGGITLETQDLKRMADTLATTVDIRRTVRGKKGPTNEVSHTHKIELPDEVEAERMAIALSSVINGARPERIGSAAPKRIEVRIADGIGDDTEFEG